MHLARVVADLDLERIRGGVPRLPVQLPRFAYAVRVGPCGVVELLRRVVGDAARDPAVSRCLADDRSPRSSAARGRSTSDSARRSSGLILERRTRQVEAVVVGGELRRDVQLGGQVLLDPRELLRRHDVGHVDLAGAVLAELGARVVVMRGSARVRAAYARRSSSCDCVARRRASRRPIPRARKRRC